MKNARIQRVFQESKCFFFLKLYAAFKSTFDYKLQLKNFQLSFVNQIFFNM